RLRFCLASLGTEFCVPTVRIVRSLIFQWVSADGSADGSGLTVPTVRVCVRSQAVEILRLRTVRTVRTVRKVISPLYLGDGDRADPRVPLAHESDLDSCLTQRCCRAAQATRKRPRCWRPFLELGLIFACRHFQGTQKIRRRSRPLRPRRHEGLHHRCDEVGLDHRDDGLGTILSVGSCKRSGAPERALASGGPEREVRHAWRCLEASTRKLTQAVCNAVE